MGDVSLKFVCCGDSKEFILIYRADEWQHIGKCFKVSLLRFLIDCFSFFMYPSQTRFHEIKIFPFEENKLSIRSVTHQIALSCLLTVHQLSITYYLPFKQLGYVDLLIE